MKKKNLNLPYPKQIFVFGSDKSLGNEVASLLDIPKTSTYQIKNFPDGERVCCQSDTVRGRDVYIIFTSLIGEEMDKWAIDYLRFVMAVKQGQPHRITIVMPKLIHQRQDVENRELRQPKMSEFFPKLLQSMGADSIVVCKLHNPASCTIDPPMENLDTTKIFIKKIKERFPDLSNIVVAAADMGGSKYARKIAEELFVSLVITDKDRDPKTGVVRAMNVFTQGEISNNIDTVIFIDDLISTFETICNAGNALFARYPQIKNFFAVATHPDFKSESTLKNIIESRFSEIWVTNTVPIDKDFISEIEKSGKKIIIISVAKLIARTIDNLHNGESVSALWTKNGDQI